MATSKKAKRNTKRSSGTLVQNLKTITGWFLGITGFFTLVALALSFTDIPYHAYHRLGTKNSAMNRAPEMIVILSGSGMPSPDGLIRAWYGAQAARKYPGARIVIALPYDEGDSLKPLKLMANELMAKGIDDGRIQFEPHGFNTRSQALNVAAMFRDEAAVSPVMLVTSPEHMYRSVRAFKKAGFASVGGLPAFDQPIEPGKVMDTENTGDIRVRGLNLRYNMWSYLHYELIVLREYFAIGYYRLKGWI
jgi:uncharacterized SAM-binding protein YcdF (DUF218 family)